MFLLDSLLLLNMSLSKVLYHSKEGFSGDRQMSVVNITPNFKIDQFSSALFLENERNNVFVDDDVVVDEELFVPDEFVPSDDSGYDSPDIDDSKYDRLLNSLPVFLDCPPSHLFSTDNFDGIFRPLSRLEGDIISEIIRCGTKSVRNGKILFTLVRKIDSLVSLILNSISYCHYKIGNYPLYYYVVRPKEEHFIAGNDMMPNLNPYSKIVTLNIRPSVYQTNPDFDLIRFAFFNIDVRCFPPNTALLSVEYDAPNEPSVMFLNPQNDFTPPDDDVKESSDNNISEIKSTRQVDLIENSSDVSTVPFSPVSRREDLVGFQLKPCYYPELTSRWSNLGTITISTSNTPSIVDTIDLPFSIFQILASNPATLPLLQHAFVVPQITLRWQVNATPFHSGILVAGFQYYSKLDSLSEGVRTPTTFPQIFPLDSAYINIATSGVIELSIPFQSYLDMLTIRNSQIAPGSYYATAFLATVTPVRIGTGGSSTITVTRQVKLECDSEHTCFYGQISRSNVFLNSQGIFDILSTGLDIASSIGIPGAGAVKTVIKPAEQLLTGIGKIFSPDNCDRPINPLDADPIISFPTASLSSGEGIFQGRSLRLAPDVLTPHHPFTVPSNGKTLLKKDVVGVKGYISTFVINTSNNPGDILFSIPITPLHSVPIGTGTNNQTISCITPMTGMSLQYMYWTGSIRYTFVISKAAPHSFRLRFAFNPVGNYTSDSNLNDLPCEIIDFKDKLEIDIDTPYMSATPMLPVLTSSSNRVTCGFLQVALESKLISIGNCDSAVDVVVLASAGKDFNLSVPRPIVTPIPSGALPAALSITNLSSTQLFLFSFFRNDGINILSPAGTEYPANFSQSFEPNTTILLDTPPTGNVLFLFIAEFSSFGRNNDRMILTKTVSVPSGNDIFITVTRGTFVTPGTYNNQTYSVLPLSDDYFTRNFSVGTSDAVGFTFSYTGPSSTLNYAVSPSQPALLDAQNDFLDTNANSSATEVATKISDEPLRCVNYTLGESFELASSLRRFQSYLTFNSVINNTTTNSNSFAFVFDINAGHHTRRFEDDLINNLTFNHDAYRFFKGGLRYVITNCSHDRPIVYHLPPGSNHSIIPSVNVRPSIFNLTPAGLQELCMYGHEIALNSTSSVPFEVPYYNFTRCLINGYDPTAVGIASSSAYSMGTMAIVFRNVIPSTQNFFINIERALSDDARLYVFQGWPAIQNVWGRDVNVNAQSNLTNTSGFKSPGSLFFLDSQNTFENKRNIQPSSNFSHFDKASLIFMSSLGSRSKRLGFNKYVKKVVKTEVLEAQNDLPQDIDVEAFVVELARAYSKPKKFHILNLPNKITDVIDCHSVLFLNVDDEDILVYRAALISTILALSQTYKINFDFFSFCKIPNPNGSIGNQLTSLARQISGFLPECVKNKIDNLDNALNNVPSNFFQIINKLLSSVANIIVDPKYLYFIITNVQMLISATDYWVRAMALAAILMEFGFISPKSIGIVAVLVELLYFSARPCKGFIQLYSQNKDLNGSEDDERRKNIVSFASALIAGIGATCAFKSSRNWPEGVDRFVGTFSRNVNSWSKLLSETCTFLLDYVLYVFGVESPETLAAQELKMANINCDEWLRDVLFVTDPSNRDLCVTSPSKRLMVARLYNEGLIFLKNIDSKTHPKLPVFLSIWRKLTELYTDTGEVPDPIRANMTPICVWLYGAPGVGKSEAAKRLAINLAACLDITFDGDPFFIRRARKYWDGYNGQPIIILDDALQVKNDEAVSTFIADWFGLFTPAPFSPEFAQNVEKRKFVAPRVVICTSNICFPDLEQHLSDIVAFQRRRDILLEVTLNPECTDKGILGPEDPKMDPKVLENFDHLLFSLYHSATNRQVTLDSAGNKTVSILSSVPKYSKKKLKECVQEILPRINHLIKLRTQSATNNVALSQMLSPLHIAATREEILGSIDPTALVSGLTNGIQNAATSLIGQNEEDEPMCECDDTQRPMVKRCVHQFIDLEENEKLEYCFHHKNFFISLNKRPLYILNQCNDCVDSISYNIKYNSLCHVFYKSLSVLELSLYRSVIPLMPVNHPTPPTRRVNLTDFFSWLYSGVKSIWSALPSITFYALSLLVVSYFIFKSLDKLRLLFNFIRGKEDNDIPSRVLSPLIPQMASSGATKTSHVRHSNFTAPKPLVAQGSVEDLFPRVRRNCYNMRVYNSETGTRTFALGLFDQYAVATWHTFAYFADSPEPTHIDLSPKSDPNTIITIDYSSISYQRINETDLCLIKFPKRIPAFRNISRSLVSGKMLAKITRKGALLNVLDSNMAAHYFDLDPVKMRAETQAGSLRYQFDMLGFSYPFEKNGLCGSVLIDRNSGFIIGVHTHGKNGVGYSTLLCQEYFSNFMPTMDVEEPSVGEGSCSVKPKGAFIEIGKVLDGQNVHMTTRTEIIPSMTVGVLDEPKKFPAVMVTAGESLPGVTNLTKAVEKGGNPPLAWNKNDVAEVVSLVKEKIFSLCKPTTTSCGVRSINEAVCGVVGMPFAEALKRTTSVGWPLSTLGKGTRKENFIQYNETNTGLEVVAFDPDLAREYRDKHEMRKKGIIPFSAYQNFLKDERREAGKTPRLINGCPLEQVIEFRRYCLDFFSAVQENGNKIGIMIGMNVHGMDWTNLIRRLISKSDFFLCGDYSAFGPGLDPELVMHLCDIVVGWYNEFSGVDPERDLVINTLFHNLAFSYEVSLDSIFQTMCGSPSGNPFTAIINSLIGLMYILLAWMECFRGTTIEHPKFFFVLCEIGIYGDDIIMTVDPSIIELFNNQVIHDIFKKHNIKYTDINKTGEILKWRPLDTASFLKCSIIPHPTRGKGFYLAALEKETLVEIPNWIRKGGDVEESSKLNCVEACRFAYAWGKEYHSLICSKIQKVWRSLGTSIDLESWHYLDRLFFGELSSVMLPKDIDPTLYDWA